VKGQRAGERGLRLAKRVRQSDDIAYLLDQPGGLAHIACDNAAATSFFEEEVRHWGPPALSVGGRNANDRSSSKLLLKDMRAGSAKCFAWLQIRRIAYWRKDLPNGTHRALLNWSSWGFERAHHAGFVKSA
jgi:hypothetical protein